MNYNVRILHRAEEDVNAIYLWLLHRESGGATRWFQAFLEAAESLSTHAAQNAIAPEAPAVGRAVRLMTRRRFAAGHLCDFYCSLHD